MAEPVRQTRGPTWQSPERIPKITSIVKRALCFDLQILLAIPIFVIIGGLFSLELLIYFLVRITGRFVEKWCNRPKVRRLIQQMRKAESFEMYSICAERLDELTKRNIWKECELPDATGTPDYDPVLIRRKLNELKEWRITKNYALIIMSLKSCLETDLYHTLHPSLFSMTFSGTKQLAHDLHEEIRLCISFLRNAIQHSSILKTLSPTLLDYLIHLDRVFGSSGLVLSGGAMLGLHHLGLIEALLKMKLLPNIISGTSAGSVAAAFVCTRSDDEALQFLQNSDAMEVFRSPFEPNNWLKRLCNFFQRGYTINVEAWLDRTAELFGETTFLEAYTMTGRILNITASRAGSVGESIVLNYRNAPNVLITTAVLASSAFPYLGCPIHLMEKDPKTGGIVVSKEYSDRFYHDGSLRGDVPSTVLRSTWGVKYIIVSQVNPHVFPFLGLRTHGTPGLPVRGWGAASVWRGGFPLALFEVLLKEHLRFLLRVLALSEVIPTINGINIGHVALQTYGGDLNVYPSRLAWPHILLMNNIPSWLSHWFIQVGRQMIFPKMWLLRARIQTELSLQKLVQEVKLAVDRMPLSEKISLDFHGY